MTIEPVDSVLGVLSDAEIILIKAYRELNQTGQDLVRALIEYMAANKKPTK